MKISILFPPQWSPLSPHCAPTIIGAELKNAGYQVSYFDLNIDFYNYSLTIENIKKQVDLIIEQKKDIVQKIREGYKPDIEAKDYSFEYKILVKKLNAINNIQQINSKELVDIIEFLPEALDIMKNHDKFFELKNLQYALFTIDLCLKLISLPYYPWELRLDDCLNPYFKYTYENIKKASENSMFDNFYRYKTDEIIASNPDVIGISISSSSQFISSLNLIKILKEKTDKPIFIGGNYISRITDAVIETKEFLNEFAPYIIYEEGEKAVVEFCRYLEGELPVEKVSSLIYRNSGDEVIKNPKSETIKLNDTHTSDLDGYKLKDYLLPEIVMPIQASRGCYWKKCTFCDHDFGQTFNVKSINRLIEDIEYLQGRYGISNFEFTDEAITANYLKNFSKEIIKRNIKINWYCNCRLENDLTSEVFELARQAGLRMILWGYESGSEKIMKLINKGVEYDKRLEILKRANDADIWNFAYIFFGFPTETIDDANDTLNTICDNTDIIPAYGRSVFTLGKHALMRDYPEQFGIEALNVNQEPFSSNCSYKITSGLAGQELNDFMLNFTKQTIEAYNYPAWMTIRYRETLFLYICKYSMQTVKHMNAD